MQTPIFNDPILLANEFIRLADSSSWEKEGISFVGVDNLIKNNLRLILEQTENQSTAPTLQTSLRKLHQRISKESDSPQAKSLAFKIMGYEQGLYDAGPKPEWGDLPGDLLRNEIFKDIPAANANDYRESMFSGLLNPALTSRKFKEFATVAKKDWVSQESISPRIVGCKTAKEAVQYIIDNKILDADLSDFQDLTDEDVQDLTEKLPQLRSLHIFSFHIKNIPIAKLPHLTSLILSASPELDQDKLAEALTNCPNLKNLALPWCLRTPGWRGGALPPNMLAAIPSIPQNAKVITAISKLINLTNLNLSDCNGLDGDSLAVILSNLSKLESLQLSGCQRIQGDNLTNALANLVNLTNLDLSFCSLIDGEKLAKAISKLIKLTKVNLVSCDQIQNNHFAEAFATHTNLKSLDLSNTGIEGNALKEIISHNPNLIELRIPFCVKVDGANLADGLSRHPTLEILDIEGCTQIDEDNLHEIIFKHRDLKKLNLRGCTQILGDKLFENLPYLTNLLSLNLFDCINFKEEKLAKFLSKCPNLNDLIIMRCQQIQGDILAEELQKLTNLTNLRMGWCDALSGSKLPEALSKLINLVTLEIKDVSNLDGEKLTNALSKLIKLSRLYIDGSTQIEEELTAKALSQLSSMLDLRFFGCTKLTGVKLSEALPNLKWLNSLVLSDIPGLQIDKISEAIPKLPNLEFVGVRNCYIPPEKKDELERKFPFMNIS